MNEHVFERETEEIIKLLKAGARLNVPDELTVPLPDKKKLRMFVITERMLENDEVIMLLAQWRDASNVWFPAQFPVTFEGTKKWAINQLMIKKDRILFFLQVTDEEQPFGHVGLYRFNYKDKSCEIDNIIRGATSSMNKGVMTNGVQMLIDWTFKYLKIEKVFLQVFSDNERAIKLYERLGFKEISRTPLLLKVHDGIKEWVESSDETKAKRFFVKMQLHKDIQNTI